MPEMGRIIRNLIMGALWLHDHVLHFYHLAALDYIDPTAILSYNGGVPELVAVKDKIKALADAGDLHPILPSYKPDDFCVNDPGLVTQLVYNYIQALDIQAKGRKAAAVFSGKQPHHSSIVVGGVTSYPTLGQIQQYKKLIDEIVTFTRNVYIPNALLLAEGPLLPLEVNAVGATAGHYMSYGAFPQSQDDSDLLFPPGVIFNNSFNDIQPLDLAEIREELAYSWYQDEPVPADPAVSFTNVDMDKEKGYSFIKAPRYQGKPIEVGPLARMLVMQNPTFMGLMNKYNIKTPGLVMRHAARAVDSLVMADTIYSWIDELTQLLGETGVYGGEGNALIHDKENWEPVMEGKGVGLIEAPRGALGHWIEIADKKTKQYQMIVPSTWNASPIDEKGQHGPYEEALIGAPVPDPENPLNVVRIIRSFDPCLACAIHIIHPKGDRVFSTVPKI